MPDEQKQDHYCFRLGDLSVDPVEEGKKKRTFSGVAYSGEVITDHWYWTRVIFDLDSMQIKGRIPALLEHSSRQRAGAINTHTISHQEGLVVHGDLMSNEFGTQVAQDSDDGFPWQMSVRIEPAKTEEVAADQTVIVNGKTLQGPITIFRGGRIREVSFCALGADENTMAVAASHNPNNQREDTSVDLDQAKARIAELETERDTAQAELKQFKSEQRHKDIGALETELKTQFSAEDKAAYTAMDDSSFSFTAKQLRQFSGKNTHANAGPSNLFTHQAKSDGNEKQTFGTGSLVDQAKQRK